MRGFQVTMFMVCLCCGIYLLIQAPAFFLPDRYLPTQGWQFTPMAARVLGGALLTMAALALIFLRHHYFSIDQRPPTPAVQKIYFALVVLTLGLLTLSLNLAEPVTVVKPPARTAPPGP
ncbi:hypothetical protein AGMMS49960_02130 [Betaproteobacteria bacterium]|nr:hypothetical protein AGMMS49543_15500 [Betaproteobacteria bacterium]GHT98647.1 hypothetical protein AGMMS49960_02130 [Betaproteobacteria bacterium]GHU24268.1 hypothetical protein AGMMS50243_27140 [Betaproteobacteria bacterium]